MSGILDLLNSSAGRQLIQGVAGQTNQSENKTAEILTMALPILTGAMKRNASTPEGASGLLSALGNKHDGSILDDLGGLFGGGVDQSVMDDGAGILGHILGNRQPRVEQALSQKSGVDAGSISQILKIAAPILLGFLGKQQRSQQVNEQNGLGDLLGGLLGGGAQATQNQSLIESLLDADNDGSMIDDIAGMLLKGESKGNSGGLGGMLGGLFGK